MSASPSVTTANAMWTRGTIAIMTVASLLPFLLPNSKLLTNLLILSRLDSLVPVAERFSAVSSFPNMARSYVVLIYCLASVAAVIYVTRLENFEARAAIAMENSSRVTMVFKSISAVLFFGSLEYMLFNLPGEFSADDGPSRMRLIISLASNYRLGLAFLGSFTAGAIFSVWIVICISIYNFFYSILGRSR